MTREEKLYSMTMRMLIEEAEKLGIKIDRKGSKQKAVEKMLAAEKEQTTEPVELVTEEPAGIPAAGEIAAPLTQMEPVEEPEKKQKKERKKKAVSDNVSGLLAYVIDTWQAMGGNVREPKKAGAFKALCSDNGRQVLKLMWTTKKVSLFTRVPAAVDYAERWQKINYSLPFQCMFFNNILDVQHDIKNLMELVMNADSIRIKKKLEQ